MKTCSKCNESKSLSDFYKHPQTSDGHFKKCKICTIEDANKREQFLRKHNPEWLAAERERCRNKTANYRAVGLCKEQPSKEVKERWRKKNKHKVRAEQMASWHVRKGNMKKKTKCEDCGASGTMYKHHEDYSKPLSVEWLCSACHGKRHWKK